MRNRFTLAGMAVLPVLLFVLAAPAARAGEAPVLQNCYGK